MIARTPQQKTKEKLESLGTPFHEIRCYGKRITVACASLNNTEKWIPILSKFADILGTIQETVYSTKTNRTYKVWKIYASAIV